MENTRLRSRRRHQSMRTFLGNFSFKNPFQASNLSLWSNIAVYSFYILIAGLILTVGMFLWFSRDLPSPGKLVNAQLGQSTRIFDKNGILLYSVYNKDAGDRVYTPLPKIAKYVQQGTISVEDRNFYTNSGFSITGYLRAIRNIIIYHSIAGGGSTLTQQLVKNVLLQDTSQTLPRKIKELILAIEVDKKYSKNDILEMYLNDVSYGGTNIGVEAASEAYFNKKADQLDLAQSAMLAGIPQAPTSYSPFNPEKYYIARTNVVLTRMVEDGYITDKQKTDALNEVKNMTFSHENSVSLKAPTFVMMVKQQLSKQFGEQAVESGGLQVTTTLDYGIQKQVEQIIPDELAKIKNYHVGNAAAIVTDPKTGAVLAYAGGKDYFCKAEPDGCTPGKNCTFEPYVDLAAADRQPGSSLKPIMYATAFSKGYTAASLLMDTPTDFPLNDGSGKMYTPVNYDGKFMGPMQVRFALGNSRNIPAVKMLAKVGIKDVMQNAYNMGISNWQPTSANLSSVGLSLVLGGRETTLLDETTAYGTFADQGVRHDPVFITKVTDAKGNVLYEYKPTQGTQVLSPEISFLISHILLDNNARQPEFGLYSSLVVPGKTVSVKTGTTDDKRDNWTMGYTPSYVVGVWVGNDDNEPMNQAISSGITGAAPIWNGIMRAILKGKPDEQPKKPDDVNAVQIDAYGGGLPVDGKPTRSEYFIKGTEPTAKSPIYQKLKVQKGDHTKAASQDQIDHGDYDQVDFIVLHEDDPVSTDGQNRWQAGIDTWIKQTYAADHPEYYPPGGVTQDSQRANTTPTPTSANGNEGGNPTDTPTPTLTPTPTP